MSEAEVAVLRTDIQHIAKRLEHIEVMLDQKKILNHEEYNDIYHKVEDLTRLRSILTKLTWMAAGILISLITMIVQNFFGV